MYEYTTRLGGVKEVHCTTSRAQAIRETTEYINRGFIVSVWF